MSDTTEDLIAALEAQGYRVIRDRDTPDEQLRIMWQSALKTLRMAEDIARDGARLRINHPAYFSPSADPVALLRSAIVGKVDAILGNAVVVREHADAE